MLAQLQGIVAELKSIVSDLDASALHPKDAVRLLAVFADGERMCAAGKTLVAARAEDSGEWARAGHRSAATWLASETGTSVGAAVATLETSDRLPTLPVLENALRSGKVSEDQANVIAPSANHATETQLVAAAEVGTTMRRLRERCAEAKAAQLSTDEADARYERVRRGRRFRHWSDAEGAFCFEGRTTPDAGAELMAEIEAERERLFAAARAAGSHEPYEAYAVDALLNLVKGDRGGPRAMVHVRVAESGNATVGGVPIPDVVAKGLIADSLLKVILTSCAEVAGICSTSRTIPDKIRTAVYERSNKRCEIETCDATVGLEFHHWQIPFAEGGPSELWNLMLPCKPHHYLLTHKGFAVEKTATGFRLVTPDEKRGPP